MATHKIHYLISQKEIEKNKNSELPIFKKESVDKEKKGEV
jgi:hypothetical protein